MWQGCQLPTDGIRDGDELAARLLLDPGDRVWVEDLRYVAGSSAPAGAGAQAVPVPADADGIDVAAGERAAPDARFALVTPSHQYPLGVAMSLARRLSLLNWAERANAWIIKDDCDGDYLQGARTAARRLCTPNPSTAIFACAA